MRILNDIHAGALRSAGTTNVTQYALRQHVQDEFRRLLPVGEDCMILGDLFDTNNVPISDVLGVYVTLRDWFVANPGCFLYNVNGNHDASKTSNVLSSFEFLGKVLSGQFPAQYKHITEPEMTPYGYVIPHVRNQDLFDIELGKVPETEYLFLHCNYDNHFATQSDQSLNMSAEQVQASPARHVVFAHEHHGRDLQKVLIPGNQIATSVSDWMSPQDKRYLSIVLGRTPLYTVCAQRSAEFVEMDWQSLQPSTQKFVRVVGEASAEQASDVLTAINRFRKASDALVITNGVTVHSEFEAVDFEATVASVQNFSVMDSLRQLMTREQIAFLEKLCS